ncbi:MAG TPA: TonB-dependent receptor [Pyrinomonadaceae bacterium]|nr:TonB-dependent receptor [Pyrinomonadaceae bacterium]
MLSSQLRIPRPAFVLCVSFTLVFVLFTTAYSQTTSDLSGHINDPQGASLARARVTLHARDRSFSVSTTTDASGSYHFEDLAPGEYLIEARATGFAAGVAKIVSLPAQTTLDIQLELSAVENTVVVTAADNPQAIDEVSKALTVVDNRQIEARDESSITEALRTVPGLRIQQLGGPGSFTAIKTRGLRNEDTAVLIDGLRFRDVTATQGDASGFLQDLLVTDIDRIEVLRGSGSSLYGSNAIGGVINLVTDEGGGPVHGSILGEGGGLGLFRTRAQIAGGAARDRVVYSGAFSFLDFSDGVDQDDAARNSSGQGRLVFRLGSTSTLTGRIFAGNGRARLNNNPAALGILPANGIIEAVPLSPAELRRYESGVPPFQLNANGATFIPSANDPDNERQSHFFDGALIFNHRPVEAFGYSLSYHGFTSHRRISNGPLGVDFQPFGGTEISDFDGRIHTLTGRFDLITRGVNNVSGGYEFESETFKNVTLPVDPAQNSSVNVTQRSHGFFIQDQLRLLNDRLQISGAFRAQLFRLQKPAFAPATAAPYNGLTFSSPPNAYTGDGSVAYLLRSTQTKLRGHVGNGYRAPSLFERFGTFFGFFGYSVFGDPRLQPEHSIAFDAGIDQTFYNEKASISASYFYTALQKVIIFDFSGVINPATDPFGRFGGYRNSEGGIARGVELSFTTSPTRDLNIATNYTYTKSLQRTPQAPGTLRSLVIPDHQFSIVATQRFGKRLMLNLDFAASSDYLASVFDSTTFANRAYRFRGLAKADAGASYTFPLAGETRGLRLFGYVDNIFDREYFESGFRTAGRTGRAGVAFNF